MKRFAFLLFFILLTFILNAQRFNSFSTNPALTVEEMKQFMETLPKDKQSEANKLVEKFSTFWTSPSLNNERQLSFIDIANAMLKKRMRPFPHFDDLIDVYIAFYNNELSEQYVEWSKMLKYHIE